jgi:hypothetical protein
MGTDALSPAGEATEVKNEWSFTRAPHTSSGYGVYLSTGKTLLFDVSVVFQ